MIQIRIRNPVSGSKDPSPSQNVTNPDGVSDPDPDWIQSGQWIRIQNPNPVPGGKKITHKNIKKRNFML
jgi:hypothetical protein